MLTGPYIRAARAILKISQVQLATMVGVSYVVIRNIESCDGICDGKGHVLFKMHKIFTDRGVSFTLHDTLLTISCEVKLEDELKNKKKKPPKDNIKVKEENPAKTSNPIIENSE